MRRNDLLLTFLGALMLALSRLPLHLGWLVFFAWLPYLHVFERGVDSRIQLLRMGFVTSVVYILIVFYWFALVTVPGLIGMVILYTFVYYLFFWAINRIFRTLPFFRYAGFIALIITFEYIQNFGQTRFPWFNLGYSLAEYNILVQLADSVGVVGLSALILIIGVLLHQILPSSHKWLMARRSSPGNVLHPLRARRVASWLVIILILAVWLGYGYHSLRNTALEGHDAGIFVMQPSINQDVKWDPDQFDRSLALFQELTLQAAADSARIVIWPEGAVTNYMMRMPGIQRDLREILDTTRVDIFTGFPDVLPAPVGHINSEVYYNAASLFQPDNFYHEIYYKNILVPVAERMLWLDQLPFMWKLQFGQANWEFGTELQYYESGGFTFSPSICYELAFPELFHRMAIPRDPDSGEFRKCDYLVNITNDAWFGTSYGPWLHASMARFRAVENRVQIYRSANTGISMIVDPRGKILESTDLFEVKNITAPIYTTAKVPLIRKIHRYPLLLVGLALSLTLLSCFRRNERPL
ncbi:MAG: apolipoprotein N-acyltransferase [Candidatus Syntrophosphaera sp.]|nr:apolipoprotein N-acyltransferase [Candidatus Syntrophosphaera sp.]